MNILDENVLESQRLLLLKWRMPFRQIGYGLGRKGMKDDEIIRFLLRLRQPTFFTLDSDFYRQSLCHPKYALVYLDVEEFESALFVRRLLRHRRFNTHAKRMGVVIRASHAGVDVWHPYAEEPVHFDWANDK